MIGRTKTSLVTALLTSAMLAWASGPAAADTVRGKVLGGGQPIANATVTLWSATSGAPTQLGQARTDADGSFTLNSPDTSDKDAILYLIAKGGQPKANVQGGDNPAIALMTVIGTQPAATVTINEMTTVASVWTHAQFSDGTAIKGPALGLRIAAGNVHNFVDLATGGFGATISDALNSAQTPTMANFTTLADVITGCVTRVMADACPQLYTAATPPKGDAPNDTLTAAQSIARYPWYQPEKIFALLEKFYPIPAGKPSLRPTPFMPYLTFAPSAWVLPLKFTGGGYHGGGKLMFDSQGNVWTADNFQVASQAQDYFWQGTVSKFAPDGTALSPPITGFTGGGLLGPGFGLAIDTNDNAWLTSFEGNKNIVLFDKNGKPLSPPEGYTFGGTLNKMQGIIVTPSGDVWAADMSGSRLVHLPKGDPSKGEVLCKTSDPDPLKNPCKVLFPFALAIDQKDNIWVSNALADHVTRFPASDPTKLETFKTGFSGSGLAVDSLGNVWVTNKLGNSEHSRLKLVEMALAGKLNYDGDPDATARATSVLVNAMFEQKPGWEGGSLTVLRPDGTEANFSPIYGKGIYAPWAVSVDGNNNIWVSNFARELAGIVQLCGFRTENCPPGVKTGDAISPRAAMSAAGCSCRLTSASVRPATSG